jgi:hypothetical protein
MAYQTLKQRLDARIKEYDKAKKQHRKRNHLFKEMSYLLVKLLKREIAQDKRKPT